MAGRWEELTDEERVEDAREEFETREEVEVRPLPRCHTDWGRYQSEKVSRASPLGNVSKAGGTIASSTSGSSGKIGSGFFGSPENCR